MTSYGDTVEQAYANRDNPTLRDAYLGYADSILRHGHSGILDRLKAVQKRQFDVLDDQTSFGWLLTFAWWLLVPGLFLTLAALLVHTQRFLRHPLPPAGQSLAGRRRPPCSSRCCRWPPSRIRLRTGWSRPGPA
ncbi:hypothetical protein SANTM175S_02892 [Streptomyces antimycoticus]